MRNKFGNTWWGQQWLNALNDIDYSNRLPRGRRYANNGSVREINIDNNVIAAKVQGRRPSPYKVNIEIPVFDASDKAKVIEIITSNPLFLSQLLNRELPSELNEACREKGVQIFPTAWDDLKGGCSCPDWAVPCKHMAAVLYLVANEIDKNPFVVFELHDFDLFKGLEGVGFTTEEQKEIGILSVEDLYDKPQLGADEAFEWNDESYRALDFSTLPNCKESLLTILSEKPVFFPAGDFRKELGRVYNNASRALVKEHKKALEQQEESELMDLIENVELILDAELDFKTCNFRDRRGKMVLNFKDLADFVDWLSQIPSAKILRYSESLRGLYLAYRLAFKLVEKSAFIPQFLSVGRGRYKVRWVPALLDENVVLLFEQIRGLVKEGLLTIQLGRKNYEAIEDTEFQSILSVFLGYFVRQYHKTKDSMLTNPIVEMFFLGELQRFNEFETQEYPNAIQLWINKLYISDKDYVPLIQVEELPDGSFETKVMVENKTKEPSLPISIADLFSKKTYSKVRLEVLRDLAMLTDYFPRIKELLATRGKTKLLFDSNEFVEVLFKLLPTIELFGINVMLPKALKKLLRPQLSMSLDSDAQAEVGSGIISLENILNFQWRVALGDQLLTEKQFLKMVKQYSGIVKMNDEYVYFDHAEIANLINKLEDPPALTGTELLHTVLTEEYDGARVEMSQRLQKSIKKLLGTKKVKTPKSLLATLRPYQQRGYEWLYKNATLGLGSLIADDMGLGKTLQVISTLLKLKEDGSLKDKKALIIVPTTLLSNWEKEIQKFAPELTTMIYHGTKRDLKLAKDVDLLITTYGVARSDAAKLNKENLLAVVIDEAQNIKNPGTAQTKAVKKIKAPVKIAMTGTPVENRMSEYWSVFDFANKGYLGGLKHFTDTYAVPIEIARDQKQLNRFLKLTSPFIMRRVKTDKSIISDLPDKIVTDQYCELTSEQTAIYESIVQKSLKDIEVSDGINRRGLILKLITGLKQVCNHPKHFLKKGKSDPLRSGKCVLLFDLLRQIQDNGEKTLIFTQYQEMGKLLVKMIKKEFNIEAPFLHGGVSRKNRDAMVEDFQNNRSTRIMLLSLKAGGTGLNLTAANNVIHYDLWWNPAVEAQATDRAFRIGQKKNVLVHRFITQGSFEEKINELLNKKKELANLTVSNGEKWIGDFSNAELKQLVALG